jgi:membrane-associated phospholipid phosphatase
MGDLNTLPLIGAAVAVIAAVAWARMVTGNHTRIQIALGILVSVVSVVLAYGLMSLWRPL